MGFFLLSDNQAPGAQQKQEDLILHRLGCKVCPLNQYPGRMEPTGAKHPLIYMLGEAPGKTEIDEGCQFVGKSGQLLRPNIPREMRDRLRWNNCVRSHPPANRTPERTEIEACRPSVVADIEQSKPKAIFGFGGVPLHWVSGFSGITLWRGRKMPVKVGNHTCWFYPFVHPAWILRQGSYGSEDERMFRLDLDRAFREVERLPAPKVHTVEDVYAGLEILQKCDASDLRRLEVLLGAAAKAPAVGIDYETHGLRPYSDDTRVLTAAVSVGEWTVSFPFDHPDARWTKAHRRDLQKLWVAFLTHCKARKISHNLAFELEWTGVKFGPELIRAGRWEDSATQACMLDERTGKMKPGPFALEFLVQQYFGFNLKKLADVDRNNLINEPLEAVLRYNGPDAKYHLYLWEKQKAEIERQRLTEPYELALRRVPTVTLSQMLGVPVDQAAVQQLQQKYSRRIQDILGRIAEDGTVKRFRKEKKRPFNPMSNPDAVHLFHTMLKCKECQVVDKYSKKEKLSVDAGVLEKIAKRYPLAQLLMDLRSAAKMKSTYIDPMAPATSKIEKMGPEGEVTQVLNDTSVLHTDGLLHCRFNTIFAETGRLSSEEPNLQNYPKRDDGAKEVRLPIRAAPSDWILAFDYGQIEARVIAMFTQDKRFVDALWTGFDVHADWAKRISEDYPERIGGKQMLGDKKALKDFRTDIKNQWTFPLFFGAQLRSAANYLSIPERVLEPHYKAFWKEFHGVKTWQEEQLSFYQDKGYVECLTGRRRRGPFSVNQVFNTPVQGTAAEIVLDAMSRLAETGDPLLHPEINIHDDLTFLRVPKNKFDYVVENVVKIMLDVPFEWARVVPISVELSVGQNWMKMDEVGKFSSDDWLGHKRPK